MIRRKLAPVIGQVGERRQRGDLAQAVDVVAVADFLQRGDQFGMAGKIADALKTKRIGLGKSARHQDVRKFQRERKGVFPRKIDVSFVQHHHAFLRAAKFFQFRGA